MRGVRGVRGVRGENGEGGMERKEDLKGVRLMVRGRLDFSSGMSIGVGLMA